MGTLLDGVPAPGDYVDGRVVISHRYIHPFHIKVHHLMRFSGGKSAVDSDGIRHLTCDQSATDNTRLALYSNMKHKMMLVLIMGEEFL